MIAPQRLSAQYINIHKPGLNRLTIISLDKLRADNVRLLSPSLGLDPRIQVTAAIWTFVQRLADRLAMVHAHATGR